MLACYFKRALHPRIDEGARIVNGSAAQKELLPAAEKSSCFSSLKEKTTSKTRERKKRQNAIWGFLCFFITFLRTFGERLVFFLLARQMLAAAKLNNADRPGFFWSFFWWAFSSLHFS